MRERLPGAAAHLDSFVLLHKGGLHVLQHGEALRVPVHLELLLLNLGRQLRLVRPEVVHARDGILDLGVDLRRSCDQQRIGHRRRGSVTCAICCRTRFSTSSTSSGRAMLPSGRKAGWERGGGGGGGGGTHAAVRS